MNTLITSSFSFSSTVYLSFTSISTDQITAITPIDAGTSTYLLLGFNNGIIIEIDFFEYISPTRTKNSTISISSPIFIKSSL